MSRPTIVVQAVQPARRSLSRLESLHHNRTFRPGRVNALWLAFLAAVAVLVGLVVMLLVGPRDKQPTLVVYCAPAVQKPVEAVAKAYEQAYGVKVQLDYGPSQTLLSRIETAKQGDLFIPADDSYLTAANDKGLVDEVLPVARMRPVLAVKKGNAKGIKSVDDLGRDGVKVSVAEPGAAIHKMVQQSLTKTGDWAKLKDKVLMNGTVSDVANGVKLGSVDAGFVWAAMLQTQYPELEAVPLPQLTGAEGRVAAGVLRSSQQAPAALRFARFLAARDKGLVEFKKQGYDVVDGDAWAEAPELRMLAGAMLRPAIEETITAFERREGCKVTRVYNGCGILVSQMKAGERPDAYFACDTSFMTQVSDLFVDPTEVSGNQLVIAVPKGNPKGIKVLKDLGQDGLRVGVGHEKQCALGALTQQTLIQDGTYAAVTKNVTVQSPTGDFLVNQLRTGSLDAVVAYISNTAAGKDALDAIPIDIPCALAAQPVAAGRETKYPQMTRRLIAALESRQSKERFLSQGFTWKLGGT